MAKFKCTACKKVVESDLRKWPMRQHRGKTKYKSYCPNFDRFIFMMKQK